MWFFHIRNILGISDIIHRSRFRIPVDHNLMFFCINTISIWTGYLFHIISSLIKVRRVLSIVSFSGKLYGFVFQCRFLIDQSSGFPDKSSIVFLDVLFGIQSIYSSADLVIFINKAGIFKSA